jgi:hypothetical protein
MYIVNRKTVLPCRTVFISSSRIFLLSGSDEIEHRQYEMQQVTRGKTVVYKRSDNLYQGYDDHDRHEHLARAQVPAADTDNTGYEADYAIKTAHDRPYKAYRAQYDKAAQERRAAANKAQYGANYGQCAEEYQYDAYNFKKRAGLSGHSDPPL